jgi:hypothetical protein
MLKRKKTMQKRYRLTNDSIEFNGRALYRIEALIDFATQRRRLVEEIVQKLTNKSSLADIVTKGLLTDVVNNKENNND